MSTTMTALEVLELIESTLQALTPAEQLGDFDRFTVCHTVDEVLALDRDRAVIVSDVQAPQRRPGSGGCQVATMPVLVSVLYGSSRESRARRLLDAPRISEALLALRRATPAIDRLSVEPVPTRYLIGGLGALASWHVETQFFITSGS